MNSSTFILKRPGNENQFCTMNIPSAHTVVFKCIFTKRNPEKTLTSPGEKADSGSQVGNIQDELEHLVLQTARETSKTIGTRSKQSGANSKKFPGAKGRTL